jgi:hypothetical protein
MTGEQANEALTRRGPRFTKAGSVSSGTPCAQCGVADDTVHRIADTWAEGAPPEALHFAYAPSWFGRARDTAADGSDAATPTEGSTP